MAVAEAHTKGRLRCQPEQGTSDGIDRLSSLCGPFELDVDAEAIVSRVVVQGEVFILVVC